jgi:hypothetical protein
MKNPIIIANFFKNFILINFMHLISNRFIILLNIYIIGNIQVKIIPNNNGIIIKTPTNYL